MMSNWLDRVGSVIPRGFSRHYVLTSVSEVPMSGKEIIDKAIAESGGIWKLCRIDRYRGKRSR